MCYVIAVLNDIRYIRAHAYL